MGTMQKATIFLMMLSSAYASKCTGVNGWNSPGEAPPKTGACMEITDPAFGIFGYQWHCPWESDGFVSGFGCNKVQYDCADTWMTNTLVGYYQGHGQAPGTTPLEWSAQKESYTMQCIKWQCKLPGAPLVEPTPKPVAARRLITV